MRKTVVSICFFILVLFGKLCYAEDLSEYLKDIPVNVIESQESIDIYIRFSIEGDASKYAIPGTQITYEKAFIKGVKNMWEGSYKGKPVNVHMEQIDIKDERSKVKVKFNIVKGTADIPRAAVWDRTIWIYSGDGRHVGSVFYDFAWYSYSAGHEMGHILGLGDAYTDDNEIVRTQLKTPMNFIDTPHAQDVDYYIMLKHRTWERNTTYRYGDDEQIDKFIQCK